MHAFKDYIHSNQTYIMQNDIDPGTFMFLESGLGYSIRANGTFQQVACVHACVAARVCMYACMRSLLLLPSATTLRGGGFHGCQRGTCCAR